MNRSSRYTAAALAVCLSASYLSGCSQKDGKNTVKDAQGVTETDAAVIVNTTIDPEDLDVGYEESESVKITLKKDSAQVDGEGAAFENGELLISQAGCYILSGSLDNGSINVDCGKDNKVRLVFDGVSVSCDNGPALLVSSADKVIVTMTDGSENFLQDGADYLSDSADSGTSSPDGAVFSRGDLTFNGSGTLTVNGCCKHAIVCKDDLVFTGGNYDIDAVSGGIYGKDSVTVAGGDFTVNAGTNGFKSDNTEDASKGWIYLTGGKVNVTADGDGFDAQTQFYIDEGEVSIVTGGGSENASMKDDQPNGQWGKWGGAISKDSNDENLQMPNGEDTQTPNGEVPQMPDGEVPQMPDGEIPQMPNGERPQMSDRGQQSEYVQTSALTNAENNTDTNTDTNANTNTESNTDQTSTSAKGIKSGEDIFIAGGSVNIDSSDDSLHSGAGVSISDGKVNISSGDDGIHADGNAQISGGSVTVAKSYEGLEGKNVTITGGEVTLNAQDDGINASGGSDTGSEMRLGRDGFSGGQSSDSVLTVSGGKVTVISLGDGLDSNGDLVIEGGEIFVSGPENSGNGAIDKGDMGSAWITGGTIIAAGSSGMAETFGEENSTQCSALCNFDSQIAAGSEITVSDSDGNVLISYTPQHSFNSVVFSCAQLEQSQTYTVTAGDQTQQITLENISNGAAAGFAGMGGHGNFRR